MSQPTFIHIGFPKCASTSLQRDLFSQCPHIDYLGRDDNWKSTRAGGHRHILQLATLDNLHYRSRKDEIAKNINACFSGDPDKLRVVSDELFVSTYRPYTSGIPVADSMSVAERLHDLFPEAHILMLIREQVGFWNSMIPQLVRNNRITIDADKFFEFHKSYAETGCGSFFLLADYNAIYQLYANLFGKDRVHVMLLEDLARSPGKFTADLVNLLGLWEKIDVDQYALLRHNTRATRFEMLSIKFNNIYKPLYPLAKVIPKMVRRAITAPLKRRAVRAVSTPEHIAFLRKFYAPGNRELAQATGLDLATAGYPMEGD